MKSSTITVHENVPGKILNDEAVQPFLGLSKAIRPFSSYTEKEKVDTIREIFLSGAEPLKTLLTIASVAMPEDMTRVCEKMGGEPTLEEKRTQAEADADRLAGLENETLSFYLKPEQIQGLRDISKVSDPPSSPVRQLEQIKKIFKSEQSPFKILVLIMSIVDPACVAQYMLRRAAIAA